MYQRKEVIGDCTLYLGDTMQILPTLEKADLLLSDPPYKLTSGGNGDYADWQVAHDYNNDGSIVVCDIDWPDFMPLFFAALKDPGHAYVMCNNRHVQGMLNASTTAGFRFHNLLVWDKGSATPNRWYMKNCEFVGFFFKGKAFYVTDCGAKQLIKCAQENYGDHPTTKPVALMEHYISQSTKPGQVVLDPFMGSGSTGAAAVKTGRKFVGIEIDPKYFDLACRRVAEAQNMRQVEMFA